MADAGLIATKARQRKQRRPAELQGAFVNDEQQRLLEIEEMRPVVKFDDKKCYSKEEYEAIYQERRGRAR
jgi:hypothetical protein